MGRLDEQLKRAREKAEKEFDQAEKERKKQLLRRRVQLANEGVRAFEEGKWSEAQRSFLTYISVLEHWKGVAEGGLHPDLFDRKADVTELLLISGVFWDLAKLYDKMASKEVQFKHYLNKYVSFSTNLPYQQLCAEALRKYVVHGKGTHQKEFKDAFSQLNKAKCFVAGSLVDLIEPETLPALRAYRDQVLERRALGRAFIAAYYAGGPWVARAMDRMPQALRRRAARALDRLAAKVSR